MTDGFIEVSGKYLNVLQDIRTHFINVDHIVDIISQRTGESWIELSTGKTLATSLSYKDMKEKIRKVINGRSV